MTPEFFNTICEILNQNPVIHKITWRKDDTPINNYKVFAKYKTTQRGVETAVIEIRQTPSTHMIEIYIGGQCAYAKQYTKLNMINLVSTTPHPTDEDAQILEILKICHTKTSNQYIGKLNEIKVFLTNLNQNTK